MSVLEYIDDTRIALRLSMSTPAEEEEDYQDDGHNRQADEESFMSLPDLSIGDAEDINADTRNGLPQGSDNTANQGAALPRAAATGQPAGTEVITAQTGGIPG